MYVNICKSYLIMEMKQTKTSKQETTQIKTCVYMYQTSVWSYLAELTTRRMQQRLILIWHRNSLAYLPPCVPLYTVVGRPAGRRGLTAQPSRSVLACLLMAGAPHYHRH